MALNPFSRLQEKHEWHKKTGGPVYPQPYPPQAFERAMVFVDGTNLFQRLVDQKLIVPRLAPLLEIACSGRQLIRSHVYTTKSTHDRAIARHGKSFLEGCRVILGDEIPTGDGNVREKGVDALLVADFVYHAATRNCTFAAIWTHDSDFRQSLQRVEDFGCKTALCAVGFDAPERLRTACDEYYLISTTDILSLGLATLDGASTK